MKIEVIMTAEIYRRFTLFDVMKRRKVWRSPALFAAILGSCSVVCFVMHHVRGAVFLGSVLALVGLGIPMVILSNISRSISQQIVTQGLTRPKHVYTLVLSRQKKGIHVENDHEQADYFWKDVYHVYRDKLAIYLYMTPSRAFVLPFPSLEENVEAEDLWKLLLVQLPAEKCTIIT